MSEENDYDSYCDNLCEFSPITPHPRSRAASSPPAARSTGEPRDLYERYAALYRQVNAADSELGPRALAALVAEEVSRAVEQEREECARAADAWLDALAALPPETGLVGDVAARIYRIGAKTATEIAAAIRARAPRGTAPSA